MARTLVPALWTALWMASCFGVALAATLMARRYALRRALIDAPGERRSHHAPTPRGGGIAIAIVVLAAMAVLAVRDPGQRGVLVAGGAGLLLVAGIGWIDDHRSLSARLRLAVHGLAAALLAVAVYLRGGDLASALAAWALAVVLVNVWNFMDGIDGIATTQAAVVALAYAWMAPDGSTRWLALAAAAACCGFLPCNFPRARIFLGDVGSGALGFILALLVAMLAGQGRASLPGWALLLPASAFLVDASLTLAARIIRGERWWTAHVGHAYQAWARMAGGHRGVTIAYAGWAMASTGIVLAVRNCDQRSIMAICSTWLLAAAAAWRGVQVHGR